MPPKKAPNDGKKNRSTGIQDKQNKQNGGAGDDNQTTANCKFCKKTFSDEDNMIECERCNCMGEATYSLKEAELLRTKLIRLYDAVDQISKKIQNLEIKPDAPSAFKQQQLQKAIRMSASGFMQENLMGLQALPSFEQYQQLQDKRRAEIQRKIAAERQAAMEAQNRERFNQEESEKPAKILSIGKKLGHVRNDSQDSVGRGWKPTEEGSKVSKVGDPMLQQMEIIRGYIKQARDAQRWDEMEMLEHNLKDLKDEYYRQQAQNFQT